MVNHVLDVRLFGAATNTLCIYHLPFRTQSSQRNKQSSQRSVVYTHRMHGPSLISADEFRQVMPSLSHSPEHVDMCRLQGGGLNQGC